MKTNKEGLTYAEWLAATMLGTDLPELREAWQEGEDPNELRAHGYIYFTVIVPWSDRPTQWHPTDKNLCPLSRGVFKSEADAHTWATGHLAGQPYSTRQFLGVRG